MKRLGTVLHQRQQILFWFLGALIVAGPLVCLIYLKGNWPGTGPEQISLVGVVATAAAAYLAFLAALVALFAYALADESPTLSIEVNWRPLSAGIDLELGGPLGQGRRIVGPWEITFTLTNTSRFSARNPLVRFQIADAWLEGVRAPWRREGPTIAGTSGAYIWEGGADRSIHGFGLPYVLDKLSLTGGNSWAWDTVRMSVEVVAEGFRLREQEIPVRLVG